MMKTARDSGVSQKYAIGFPPPNWLQQKRGRQKGRQWEEAEASGEI